MYVRWRVFIGLSSLVVQIIKTLFRQMIIICLFIIDMCFSRQNLILSSFNQNELLSSIIHSYRLCAFVSVLLHISERTLAVCISFCLIDRLPDFRKKQNNNSNLLYVYSESNDYISYKIQHTKLNIYLSSDNNM